MSDEPDVPSPWLTVDEAATRARVSRRTIYNEVNAARLRGARVGGRRSLRFRASWIDEWLEAAAPQEVTSRTRSTPSAA